MGTMIKTYAPATFGQLLKQLRANRGLDHRELSRMSGLTRGALYLLEADRRRPTWDTVTKLAGALNVTTDYFRQVG